jgi:DNA polymerase/3'-5' exonuclease PolX
MRLEEAKQIAEKYLNLLKPYCWRIEIAGSIRREKPEVKDIEIVVLLSEFDLEFDTDEHQMPRDLVGFSYEVNKLEKVKGEPTGKYTQRMLPEGIKLDLFMANEKNWGLIFAIRTGSAEFSHKVLARGWVRAGYKSVNGMLRQNCFLQELVDKNKTQIFGQIIDVREEIDLFNLIGVPYIEPKLREVKDG